MHHASLKSIITCTNTIAYMCAGDRYVDNFQTKDMRVPCLSEFAPETSLSGRLSDPSQFLGVESEFPVGFSHLLDFRRVKKVRIDGC
jgi:hypothetical protein